MERYTKKMSENQGPGVLSLSKKYLLRVVRAESGRRAREGQTAEPVQAVLKYQPVYPRFIRIRKECT